MEIQHYIEALTKIDNALAQVIGALNGELIKNGGDNSNSAFYPKTTFKEEQKLPKLKNIYIYKREKYYYGIVAYDGKRKSFTRKNKSELIAVAKDCLEEFKRLQNPNERRVLNNLANYYLDNVKKPFVANCYYRTLKSNYDNHVRDKIGDMKLSYITPMMLQTFFEELTSYSTRIAEDIKTLLNQIFEYAVGNGFIKTNPMRAVIVKRHERNTGRALTREEIASFKQKIAGSEYETAFLIFLYTGARNSEYNSITFNFAEKTVTVRNAKQRLHKKESFRTIPILPALYVLKPEIENGQWRNYDADDLEKKYKKYAPGRLNWLRHTFQTYCKLCVSNEIVNLWSGHELGKDMTARVYTHYPIDYQIALANNINY